MKSASHVVRLAALLALAHPGVAQSTHDRSTTRPAIASRGTVSVTPRALPAIDFRQVVRGAKSRVFPAVVFVKCVRQGLERGRAELREVSGSGVIISPSGEAITNWHVVDRAKEIRCLTTDGRSFAAEVTGADKDTDLALVQLAVPPGEKVPHATLGTSAVLEEGEFVMAMGAPWGLSRSVSIGIVSCTRRYLPDNSEYSLWLQSDCAISPGNSGGPLVNTEGEIVGINSRGYLYGGDMAFAIPSDTVRIIVDSIRAHGFVNWSWYGLQLQPLRDFDRNIYFEGEHGVIVSGTAPGSPAHEAGLQPRDRILVANGRLTDALTEEDLPALRSWLGLLPKGTPVALQVQRDDRVLDIVVTPQAKGSVEGDEYECKRWDLTVKAINQFDTPALYFHRPEGIFILGLKRPGNAIRADLEAHDILLEIDGQEVRTLADVEALHKASLENVDTRHRVVLTVLRSGLRRQVVLDFARDYERE
jgi:serine protease Do